MVKHLWWEHLWWGLNGEESSVRCPWRANLGKVPLVKKVLQGIHGEASLAAYPWWGSFGQVSLARIFGEVSLVHASLAGHLEGRYPR